MQIGQPRDPMIIHRELFCFLVFKVNVLFFTRRGGRAVQVHRTHIPG